MRVANVLDFRTGAMTIAGFVGCGKRPPSSDCGGSADTADILQSAQPVNAALLCKSPQITERFQVARRAGEMSTHYSQRLWMFCGDMGMTANWLIFVADPSNETRI